MAANVGQSFDRPRSWLRQSRAAVLGIVGLAAAGGCTAENDRTTSTEEIAAPTSTAKVLGPMSTEEATAPSTADAAGPMSTEEAAAPSTADAAAPMSAEEVAAQVAADVEAYLPAFDRHEQIRALLVFHDGEPVLERYAGAGPEDYWDVRSVTKSVVSALIGIAIDQGYIDGVDQTLGELLPDHADAMTPEVAAITLRQVLAHTAGFSESLNPGTGLAYWESDDWVRTILADRAAAGPTDGSFAYSDAGSHLLTAVLTQSTGQSALEFARANLFEPLGIPSEPAFEPVYVFVDDVQDEAFWTGYYDADFAWPADPQGHHEGAGLLKLRPQDLVRIGQLYLDGGRWNDEQVLSASWVEASTTAQVDASGNTDTYGYLWWVTELDGSPAYLAIGFGGQMIAVVPNRRLVVVIATEFDERDVLRFNKAVPAAGAIRMVEKSIAPDFEAAD